jgi:6-phosphogluconolactonase
MANPRIKYEKMATTNGIMQDKASARRADCPRHASVHPNGKWCYVNMEFSNNIMAFDLDNGKLYPFQIVSALPDYYVDTISKTSEVVVHPSGQWLYVSNRGYDSITVFSIDPFSGRIAPFQWIESGGKIPRFFAIDPSGTRLFACNQYSDTIVEFEIDLHTGRLRRTGQVISTPTPVCLIFSDGLYAKRIQNTAKTIEGIT